MSTPTLNLPLCDRIGHDYVYVFDARSVYCVSCGNIVHLPVSKRPAVSIHEGRPKPPANVENKENQELP